jgi:hypothetical protein
LRKKLTKSYENNDNFRENENVWENGRRKRAILWNILISFREKGTNPFSFQP